MLVFILWTKTYSYLDARKTDKCVFIYYLDKNQSFVSREKQTLEVMTFFFYHITLMKMNSFQEKESSAPYNLL